MRNFGFANILSNFFFERLQGLSPRFQIPPHGLRDPAQTRWAVVMRQLGGGRVATPYPLDFYHWWQRQIMSIDDYPYAGIDFCGDLDMPLPPGIAYGDIGKESQTHFLSFELFNFFCVFLYIDSKDIFLVSLVHKRRFFHRGFPHFLLFGVKSDVTRTRRHCIHA